MRMITVATNDNKNNNNKESNSTSATVLKAPFCFF